MKRELMKRMAVLAMAAAMVFTMTANVFALDTSEEGTGTPGTAITQPVNVPKDVVLFNTDTQSIYEPNITFTYTIAPQDPGSNATVTDKEGVVGTVKAGVEGLVKIKGTTGDAGTSASLVFGDDTSAASATNKEGTTVTTSSKVATRNLQLTFDTSVLSGTSAAGIYRFKITDTTTVTALTAAGIARNNDFDAVRYLDVYVEKASNGYQVYGYVLYKTTDGTNSATATESFKYDETKTTNVKVTGYDVTSEMTGTDPSAQGTSTSDEYHTYNLKVTKTTTGAMADLQHEFPVAVSFTNSIITSQADFYSTGDLASSALALAANGSYSVNTGFDAAAPKLKDGETVTFIGLPEGTKFLVNEKNDSGDNYKVKIQDATTSTALFDEAVVSAGNNTALTTATDLTNKKGSSYETEDIQITNTLDAVSPTNVVVRFAPYLFILAAAAMLLLLVGRRKKEEE